jgi:tetratricopeptide (TPR) repeat protein
MARAGDYAPAEALLRRVLQGWLASVGAESRWTLRCEIRLARVIVASGRDDEGLALARKVLERADRVWGRNHISSLYTLNKLADLYEGIGRYEQAAPLREDALQRARVIFGPNSNRVPAIMAAIATVYDRLGRDDEAIAWMIRAYESSRNIVGADDMATLFIQYNAGRQMQRANRHADAEKWLGAAVPKLKERIRADSPMRLEAMNALAKGWQEVGKVDEALAEFKSGYELAISNPKPADKRAIALVISAYGPALVKANRHAEAEPILRDALQRLEQNQQMHMPQARGVLEALRVACDALGRTDESVPLQQRLSQLVTTTRPTLRRKIDLED